MTRLNFDPRGGGSPRLYGETVLFWLDDRRKAAARPGLLTRIAERVEFPKLKARDERSR